MHQVPGKCAAGVMPNITFKEGVVMGTLNRSRFELDHLLRRLAAKYRGDTYDLVSQPTPESSTRNQRGVVGFFINRFV